jgi:hypothetical protein
MASLLAKWKPLYLPKRKKKKEWRLLVMTPKLIILPILDYNATWQACYALSGTSIKCRDITGILHFTV